MNVNYLWLILTIILISSCSEEIDKVQEDHVWKEQTDMINKAQDVEILINDAALLQRQQIEESTQ